MIGELIASRYHSHPLKQAVSEKRWTLFCPFDWLVTIPNPFNPKGDKMPARNYY
jgi:hypothetical protein